MENKIKVLIVDDEPDILEILKYNLLKEGYQVVTAKDGDEAIEKAKMFNPDLIVLDFDCDGEVTEQLKGDTRTQHIPVIALVELTRSV